MKLEFELSADKTLELDLLQLIPEQYRNSDLLAELIQELNYTIGSWLITIRDIDKILDVDRCPASYLKHLGSLINVSLLDEDGRTESERRREIRNAIAWYKVKGTYESFQIICGIVGYTVNFYDMYTDDYTTFHQTEWFVGSEDENPSGFDNNYYKSPHFGFNILLDTSYEGDESTDYPYLWQETKLNDLIKYIERMRPVNTVPHYVITLNPQLDETTPTTIVSSESGVAGSDVTIVTGDIVTRRLVDLFNPDTLFFDEENGDYGRILYFDDSTARYFDQGQASALYTIDGWKLGTGNKCMSTAERIATIIDPDFDLENVVAEGDADDITIIYDSEKVTYKITIPASTELNGASELGLYSGSEMVIASLFPDIIKGTVVELEIMVYIYR